MHYLNKMKLYNKVELALIIIASTLCLVLFIKLLFKLRSILPWRVNCWFCNSNNWVKYPEHNSWTCPKCEQYNGFTQDGDYNRPLIPIDQVIKTPKVFQRRPPKNGLCNMCNINQQLKVTQLANFVPMNEKNFVEEIESYRTQLEKAYKLCSPCKKVVQMKLYKEKETLLGTKLLETRSPEKKQNQKRQKNAIKDLINKMSLLIAKILLILVAYETCTNIAHNKNLSKTIINILDIMKSLIDRLFSIFKMKVFMTFPEIETYVYEKISIQAYIDMLPNVFGLTMMEMATVEKVLAGFVCLIQIVANILNVNSLKYAVVLDLLWSIFVICLAEYIETLNPLITSIIKMTSALTLVFVYRSMKVPGKSSIVKTNSPPKRMKNLTSTSQSVLPEDEDMALDTDDDVSLSKYGLHNTSESSNDTISLLNTSLINGRSFTPRSDSLWQKPKLNSTFCVNSVICKSPNLVSDNVFAKPIFNNYQKVTKDDSDSDLDESISSLSIGGPTKSKRKTNSIFSLRKFTATPNFVTPTPMSPTRSRPLISPSKLSTSWVAGGYWGSEGERQNVFNADGSRSSSQSSGFESQASSMNQRNVFSAPPSREESVCGEPMVLDRFPNMGSLNYHMPAPQAFSRMSSPVFPSMQYNSHVHIPQARFAQTVPQSVYNHQAQYAQSNMFKTPGGSSLIKMSALNSFTSH